MASEIMARLELLAAAAANAASTARQLSIHEGLRRNPIPPRMWLSGEELRRETQGALAAPDLAALRERLVNIYRAGQELSDRQKRFRRTVPGHTARVLRDQLASQVGQVSEHLRLLLPAVVATFGAQETRLITPPTYHGWIRGA